MRGACVCAVVPSEAACDEGRHLTQPERDKAVCTLRLESDDGRIESSPSKAWLSTLVEPWWLAPSTTLLPSALSSSLFGN
jgi:hypothetical protein